MYAQFGSLIPSLTAVLEIHLVATELMTATRLREVGISDLSLVATAISAPSARMSSNYDRLEFLGDTILKTYATVNCTAKCKWALPLPKLFPGRKHTSIAADPFADPYFPEGFLTVLKSRLVANSRLSRAALEFSLDRYIITRLFSLKEWRNLYMTDLLGPVDASADATRQLSTKTLADVVEALIGASYVDGGIAAARHCLCVFLPELDWQTPPASRDILYQAAEPGQRLPQTMARLEELIGYTFSKKSLLLDALTHPSYSAPGVGGCLERLEFLGDAILDSIVVAGLFAVADPPMRHYEMHEARSAVVNGDFLAFLVLEWSAAAVQLWRFMRFSSIGIGLEIRATMGRHAALRDPIAAALRGGRRLPVGPAGAAARS